MTRADSFFALGPDGALRAVERAGFVPTGHVAPLTCLENRVYDVRLQDGSHVVVKFYRPGRWSREAVGEEHRFLAELADAEVPVCAPLPLADGVTLGRHQGLLYALWPRTGGRSPDELPDAALPVLGRLLARLHEVGAAGGPVRRPRFDAETRVREPLGVLEAGFLPGSCARRYRVAALEIARLFEERSPGIPVHRIHGDCHRGNLLFREEPSGAAERSTAQGRAGGAAAQRGAAERSTAQGRAGGAAAQRGAAERSTSTGQWFLLDFDDFGIGPAAQDVWMLLPGRDAESLRQRAILLEAYRQLRPFAEAWLALVEPLRALRFVWYAGWIARRWHDPFFPDAFPHFGTEEYWERETRDLEEQVDRVAAGADPVAPGDAPAAEAGEAILTNRDYFWDL